MFGTKYKNQADFDKTKKIWYQLLHKSCQKLIPGGETGHRPLTQAILTFSYYFLISYDPKY